jgi:hypothetical protein
MRQPWLYFCYRIHASVVNSVTLSFPYISCHSVFSNDFKVYNDSVFAKDLWISHDITFFTIPCVSHDSTFAINLMGRSWIHWRCRFHMSVVTQFSATISRSTKLNFMRFWQFHASAMTLFLQSIWCVGHEFIDVVDSIRQLSLRINWWFQRPQRLCFR